jgi:V/A-type H+-transporting ATPase subunit E
MPIADITDKILEDAKKEAEHIVSAAKEKASEIEKRLEGEKKDMAEENEKNIQKTLLENERRVISAANQEAKLQIDNAKRNKINEVFKTALENILSLPDKEYKTLLKGLLKNIQSGVEGEIFAPKEKVTVTKETLKEAGLKNTVTPTDKFKGGIIIAREDFEYNLTFENILADKKNSLEVEVAKLLFD